MILETMPVWEDLAKGMLLGGFLVGLGIIALIIFAAVYIYTALALRDIAKKLKYKYPWLAWIPFANIALVLQLGKFHWAWVFLLVIPVLGWIAVGVLWIISLWRVYEKRKYPGALSLIWIAVVLPKLAFLALIANLVILGLVAWKKR